MDALLTKMREEREESENHMMEREIQEKRGDAAAVVLFELNERLLSSMYVEIRS